MKLRQLQYVHEVVRNGLSVSNAARILCTSQPGISHQIRALEDELGIDIFVRDKSRLVALTANGEIILNYIADILADVSKIAQIAESTTREADEQLTIVTTHTQARYILPEILSEFSRTHPHVRLSVQHCNVGEVQAAFLEGEADLAVTPLELEALPELQVIDCREYERVVVVPRDHPLLEVKKIRLEDIAAYPLVMYEQSVPTRNQYLDIFLASGIRPRVLLNAINSDVIKACVESGLGIAILPAFVYSPERDPALKAIPIGDYFPPAYTKIILSRKRPLHRHMVDFVRLLSPDWNAETLAVSARSDKLK